MMSAPMMRCVSTLVSGGEAVARAVDVALEGATLWGQFADGAQGEHLESPAVREDGTVPGLEFVQAAGRFQRVQAGTQVEVVGVAQDDLRADVLFEVAVIDALDGADGSDGHEDGSMDLAMVRFDDARTGGGMRIGRCLRKFHLSKIVKIPRKTRIFVSATFNEPAL